jgi:hypothetical protein
MARCNYTQYDNTSSEVIGLRFTEVNNDGDYPNEHGMESISRGCPVIVQDEKTTVIVTPCIFKVELT